VPLTMIEEQALTEVADVLYSYLPASGALYTFGEAAREAGAGDLWPGVKGTGLSKLYVFARHRPAPPIIAGEAAPRRPDGA
jgi:hypothetical protein